MEFTKLEKSIMERIDREYTKPIIQWTSEDMDKFFYDSKLISANTIQVYSLILKKVRKYRCEEAGITYEEVSPSKPIIEYIDYRKLREKTIMSWAEFVSIKNQLAIYDEGAWYNYRDVALFELPAIGLSAKQIQLLRTENIKELKDKEGNPFLKLIITDEERNDECKECGHTGSIKDVCPNCKGKNIQRDKLNKVWQTDEFIVTNPQFVTDITIAKYETHYMKVRVYDERIVKDIMPYVYSPYFIKGVDNGHTKSDMPVSQPSRLLAKQLAKCTHPTLDVYHLSLEDIRRSMILMMIWEEPNITIAEIKASLKKRQENDLFWLKTVASRLSDMEKGV